MVWPSFCLFNLAIRKLVLNANADSVGTDQRRSSMSDYTFPLTVLVVAYNLTESHMSLLLS